MAPRPSPPTSLLWAHQLKREHNHLLKRMQDLESASEKQENRIKTAENISAKTNASGDIEALAKQVKAIDASEINKRVSEMERNVEQKLDSVQADSEAMTLQIAALEKDKVMEAEQTRQTLQKDKALLKRIAEVEEGLKKYEASLERVGRRINEAQFQQIKQQLEGLMQQVTREGSQMKMLTESVTALETANQELSKANEKLEAELKKLASKPTAAPHKPAPRPATEVSVSEPDATPGADQLPPPKKSHKWAGGGADRDIIRSGSGMFGSPATTPRPSLTATTAPSRPPFPKKPSVAKKPAVPKAPLDPAKKKKPHRWSGGGADKDIINAGFQDVNPRDKRPADSVSEPPKPKANKWAPSDVKEKVVRAGKGWYEVVDGSSQESEAPSEPVKRKRGRPRKTVTPRLSEVELNQGIVTRRTKQQDTQVPPASKKRTADTAFGRPAQNRASAQTFKKVKIEPQETPEPDEDIEDAHPAPNVFSSPVSSSDENDGHLPARYDSKDALYDAVTSQPQQAAPTGRREIIQPDDISAIIRQMNR